MAITWARRLERVYRIDVETCDQGTGIEVPPAGALLAVIIFYRFRAVLV